MEEKFAKFATKLSVYAGTFAVFAVAVAYLVGWFSYGAVYGYSSNMFSWFSVITTIPSLLMLFLLSAASNRTASIDSLKLDMLLAAIPEVPNEILLADELDDEALQQHREHLHALGRAVEECSE